MTLPALVRRPDNSLQKAKDMKWIFSSSIRRFLVAAVLALMIPMMVVAGPRMQRDAPGECAPGVEPPAERAGEMPGLPWRKLNLDAAQQDKIFAIMHEQAPLMRERLKNLRRAEDGLRKLAVSAEYEEARAKVMAEAVAEAVFDLALLQSRTERQVFAILTPEQRKQLAAFPLPPAGPLPSPPFH